MTAVKVLRVKLFADGADKAGMLEMYRKPFVSGFTTNPTLMRKAGVSDCRAFAEDILSVIRDKRDCAAAELIWASPRELLNVFQAESVGCHIITGTNDILKKLDLVGRDLADYSLDTVKMFFNDVKQAGYTLAGSPVAR